MPQKVLISLKTVCHFYPDLNCFVYSYLLQCLYCIHVCLQILVNRGYILPYEVHLLQPQCRFKHCLLQGRNLTGGVLLKYVVTLYAFQ